MTGSATAPTDRSRWIALYVLCTGMLMIILDSTIVNVALPVIQEDLGFTQSSLAWVINAYLIAFGGLLLLAGRLGDLLGRRDVLMAGLVLFTAASLACGLATSQEMLIGARFLQGIGGALTSAVILGMIVTMFPEPRERATAIGVYSFVASSGAALGLLAGGILTQAISWHWIFIVNVPIGVATGLLALRFVPRDTGLGLRRGADIPGALLITAALMLAVYTLVGAAEEGWGSAQTIGLGTLSLVLLASFVARQATAAVPLMALRIFASRAVSGANAIQMLMVAGLFGMFFLGALYLQQVRGYDEIQTGLAFLPVPLGIGILSLGLSARCNERFGPKRPLLLGLALIVVGLSWFVRVPVDGRYLVDVLPVMVLFGAGAGLAFPAMVALAMSDATPEDSGLASGLVNTTQQVGGALGLSLLASLSTTRTEDLLAAGAARPEALTDGFQLAFAVAAGLVVLALVAAVAVLPDARPQDPDAVEGRDEHRALQAA